MPTRIAPHRGPPLREAAEAEHDPASVPLLQHAAARVEARVRKRLAQLSHFIAWPALFVERVQLNPAS